MIPVRTCVGCFKKFPQSDLVRIIRLPDKSLCLDETKSGRSVYLCKNVNCYKRAVERKGQNAITYGLKVPVTEEFKKGLRDLINQLPT